MLGVTKLRLYISNIENIIIIHMSNQNIETVFETSHPKDQQQSDLKIVDSQKQSTDFTDTNPTNDDQQTSDDDEAIVCYDFSNRNKTTENTQQSIEALLSNDLQKEEDTSNPTLQNQQKISQQNEIGAIALQPQQEDAKSDISSKKRRQSLQIITVALNQRKLQNLSNFNDLVSKRGNYYSEFTACLTNIEEGMTRNIQQTDLFGKDLMRSLKDIKQVYRNFSKELSKISFTQLNQDSFWGKIIPNGFKFITDYKNTCSETSRIFYEWIETQCLPKVQEVFSLTKGKTELESKQVRKRRQSYNSIDVKNLLINKESKSKDLLSEELKLNKLMEDEKNKAQEWGASVSRLVQNVYTKNAQILSMLKFEMASLVGHFKMISRQSHHLFQAENFWISISSDDDSMFNSVVDEYKIKKCNKLSEGDVQKLKTDNLHSFLIMDHEEQQVGKLRQVLRQLHINNYKIMCDFQKNNQWKPAQVYFSVDNHLIFVDENSHVRNVMNIMEIQYQIIDLEVKIKEKQKGLFTTWNRQKLKFNCHNQIEEFTTLIDSMRELRLQQ